MSALPPLRQCARNMCANMVVTEGDKKYCSSKCNKSASLNRRRNRKDVPASKAVESSTQYIFKKIMLSAAYLSDTYKMDREEVTEMLMEDMERRIEKFWDAEVTA